jgi:pSer/pThr/pTyr-binding forkhead associated (FHA) protein
MFGVLAMGLLDNLEQRLDRIVNGSFSKAFKSEVQPVEIGAALQQEIDTRASDVNGQLVVPNIFVIELSATDHQRLAPYFDTLIAELTQLANSYVAEQRYRILHRVNISFGQDTTFETGVFRIKSETGESTYQPPATSARAEQPASQIPVAAMTATVTPILTDISGREYRLTKSITNIGRGTDADIQITDAGASRLHCAIVLGSQVIVRDLGSTNGTTVDGQKITEATLRDGSIIKIGNTTLTYKSR